MASRIPCYTGSNRNYLNVSNAVLLMIINLPFIQLNVEFFINVNDLPSCLKYPKPRLFADDTGKAAEALKDIKFYVNSDLVRVRKMSNGQ